jgi:hypothetical protein
MATNLHRILQNFQWRIATTTPTAGGRPFRLVDPLADEIENTTGSLRKFYVAWSGSEEDLDLTDGYDRQAEHAISTVFHYPDATFENYGNLRDLVLQDRHDLIKTLRNNDNRLGYDADNTTDAIGLWHRVRADDELDTGDAVWILTINWTCTISEVE